MSCIPEPSPQHLPQPGPTEPSAGPSSHSFTPQIIWGSAGLAAAAPANAAWIWQGFLAPGAVTLLTSQWKSGKTTLAAVLLAKLKTGGQLAGLPVAPGKAIVISEEGPVHWQRRHQKLGFGDHIGWFCRPFPGKPRPDEWRAFIDHLAGLHARHPFSLLLIDPLAAFLPGRTENDATTMLDALMPLQTLTTRGPAVLIAHHPSKGETPPGQAARGSGALSGFVDILIEMRLFPHAKDDDRRRRLQAFSRFAETPRKWAIELTPDGTDYVAVDLPTQQEFAAVWPVLRGILALAVEKLPRAAIRRLWPTTPLPDETTLYRWLEEAVGQGLVCRDGRGRRNHPFRYWLPEKESQGP